MHIIVKRQHAHILGLETYVSGKPCKYGHIGERRTNYYRCVVCEREKIARVSAQRAKQRAAKLAGRERQYERPIMSRAEAREQGLTRYFNGQPCRPHGHVAERLTSNCHCTECLKQKRTANPIKNAIRCKRWRDNHREHYRKYQRDYHRDYERRMRAKKREERAKENGEP